MLYNVIVRFNALINRVIICQLIDMNNFRETKEKKNCLGCFHFCSWNSFMGDDDPLEPNDLGKCENELNEDDEGEELACGEGEICDLWKDRHGN